MEKNIRTPHSEEALLRAFLDCQRKKVLITVDKSSYNDYLIRGQRDLVSAERDLVSGDYHWCRIKAYQALFHLLNALLVKHLGYYSKDHGCVIVSLMSSKIITSTVAEKISLLYTDVLKQSFDKKLFEDIDELRLQRNFALYKPKAWEDVTKDDVASELRKIKDNFKVLVMLL
jgi:uncharacterized protein (UPF0332 family)